MAGQNSISSFAPLGVLRSFFGIKGAVQVETLTGNLTLTPAYPSILKLDPGGSARDVTLEAEADCDGALRWIVNGADAAENLVVKNDGGSTIVTINQNESAAVYCDGTSWTLIAVLAIALS
jgi:hypothetical protein